MGGIVATGVGLYIFHTHSTGLHNREQTHHDPIGTSSIQEQQAHYLPALAELYGGSTRQPELHWPERQSDEASIISDNAIVNTLFLNPQYQKKMQYMIDQGESDGMMYDIQAATSLDPIIGAIQAPTAPVRVSFRDTGI